MQVVVFKQAKKKKKSFLVQYIKVLHNLMDTIERSVDDAVTTFKVLIRYKYSRAGGGAT